MKTRKEILEWLLNALFATVMATVFAVTICLLAGIPLAQGLIAVIVALSFSLIAYFRRRD